MPHTLSPSRLPASGVLIRYQTLLLYSLAAGRPTRPRRIPLPCPAEPFSCLYWWRPQDHGGIEPDFFCSVTRNASRRWIPCGEQSGFETDNPIVLRCTTRKPPR
ncbi:hypothetical protein BDP55DRAFT_199234 [Colletotrichum godetiae]|uniref:Uncharacterized protein n=1 Tax=Colletotrichum godetiae TaxID=1209918 RepID=A0AAJ0AIA7_9PEZI|nr:uncharacterized protein BDP55DRAFT_199234 [Colletotrichum godetiae]KAK1673760.1 hypothetical protein BDP55DRAFT_199234 [Colletotrichum godetiae]